VGKEIGVFDAEDGFCKVELQLINIKTRKDRQYRAMYL